MSKMNKNLTNATLQKKFNKLCLDLQKLGKDGLVICFSGGVDSTMLAASAKEAGCQPLLLTFMTPTIARRDLTEAAAIGRELALSHQILELNTLNIPQVLNNEESRCYFCKKALYEAAADLAREQGYHYIADGCNMDDIAPDVYRPGTKAADETGVLHPLIDAGFTKEDIRAQSKKLGLRNYNRPASPCLISRFPYNTLITKKALEMAEDGESVLRQLGMDNLRLRVHGDLARLEIDPQEEILVMEHRKEITDQLQQVGFNYVCLDLAGLVSGSYDKTSQRKHKIKGKA